MEWTDIRITVPKARAEEAEAIATGISGGEFTLRITATWKPRWKPLPMWT